MKKILFITCLMVSMLARGQGYQSLIDERKQWNNMLTFIDYGGAPSSKTTMKFHVSGNDTIINDTLYNPVINTGFINDYYQHIAGFIREDISKMKVYFREADHMSDIPKDRLLYDFSLETGDTTEIFGLHHCQWFSNTYKVVFTDKITLMNEEERKVWHLEQIGDQSRESDVWIEGIGSLNGLLFPGCYQLATMSFSLDLLCYYEEGVKLYISHEDTCEIDWSSGLENHAKELVVIYPNPADEMVTIVLADEFQPCITYQIFGIDGKMIANDSFCERYETIPLTNWKPGVYYLRIFNESTLSTTKLIINK